ncbi:nuclear transport factor 2 family protein [Pseudoalteromonas sp.]|uniref:nuclear transport factor 2 family protein n=1 Tax=Pseudoalteromonas sp. TaxID=53249 RepID=UPI0035678F98
MGISILIPMAGSSTFRTSDNVAFPKMLTDINGKLLLERAASQFTKIPTEKDIVVVLPKKQMEEYNLDKVLTLIDPSITTCAISEGTQGAVCSALLAIESIDPEKPLIISSFDQVLDVDLYPYLQKFESENADAGVLTFKALHPKWSFVKLDEAGYVTQAEEKRPISDNAIAGFYYFKKASLFIEAAKNLIRKSVMHDGLFYVSHSLNEVILKGGKVLSQMIEQNKYFHFHDEHALDSYEEYVNKYKRNGANTLLKQTKAYVEAFNSKSLSDIEELISDNFSLTDPAGTVNGKQSVLEYIKNIFIEHEQLSFTAKNIIVDSNISLIEFELTLNDEKLVGTDLIKWNNDNKMIQMDAYLYGLDDGKN